MSDPPKTVRAENFQPQLNSVVGGVFFLCGQVFPPDRKCQILLSQECQVETPDTTQRIKNPRNPIIRSIRDADKRAAVVGVIPPTTPAS